MYSDEQVRMALGVMSGRIDPKTHLYYFDEAQKLHGGTLVSAADGGEGNPGWVAHCLKAEEILRSLLYAPRN